ncbi:MAG: hypothetical protein WBQ78_14355 [Gammaproteobacteria bacterium]
MKKLACCFVLIFLFTLLACGEPNQRLDEYEFYQGPQIRLKVVRYYRNIPFNYLGEYAVVMCQSENTADFSANDRQDAGWRMLGAVAGQDNTSAREAASIVKDDYEVLDNHTLVAKTSAFNISFDACGHFISWDPGRLPASMIDAVEKPDSCAPNGPVDCRDLDFEGDRAPRYEQVSVTGPGQVSFTARSKTFKGVERLHVQTRNNGAVWHVDTVALNTDGHRLVPDIVRSLSASSLEQGLRDVSLVDWLESTLPSRSMVIWPDALTTCDMRPGVSGKASAASCVEIRFNDSDGNSGALYIVMNADTENTPLMASFHDGVYVSGDSSRPVESLDGLREYLAAGTK